MKILIIEDEPKTAAALARSLREEGYSADIAENGIDGLHLALSESYELIILDVMLPKCDGWSVLRTLKAERANLPVILLTALDAVSDRVKGLDAGADDYLVKPFAFSELLARIRNVLRRAPVQASDLIRVADLEMDRKRHRVSRAGQILDLAPQEYRVLDYLMHHAGEVLTRTHLAEQVWDMNFDGDSNVIDAAIRRLRKKVDDPFEPKLIHTLRGVGYVLEVRH
ncbi:heavy metal response regulator transcription factor [Undibacterium sp. WLX3042]|uniref:heavy metal response regulator transcription factor n=1 Tax=Undibacterium sp. WLX3042 TaxID=3412686 RepID=UPI003C2CE3DD